MAKKRNVRQGSEGEWRNRYINARAFLQQSERLLSLLETGDIGNPVMTLAVQATIAYSDAITLKFGGVKNTGDHAAITQLLRSVLRGETDERQLQRLSEIIANKTWIEYGDEQITIDQASKFVEQSRRFSRWAHEMLQH